MTRCSDVTVYARIITPANIGTSDRLSSPSRAAKFAAGQDCRTTR
jgi:hypothetical protein